MNFLLYFCELLNFLIWQHCAENDMSKREVKPLETGLLVRELRDVEWDTLGRCLRLSKGEIKEIEGNYQNTGRRRIEMFDKWLSKEENPSWEKMIAALEDMSENNIASQLRKKYVYQQQPKKRVRLNCPLRSLMTNK